MPPLFHSRHKSPSKHLKLWIVPNPVYTTTCYADSSTVKFDLFIDLGKTNIHNEMGFVNLQSYLNMPSSLSQNTLLYHTHLSSWEGRRTTHAHLKKGSGGWGVKQLLRGVLDFYIKVTGTQACNIESV